MNDTHIYIYIYIYTVGTGIDIFTVSPYVNPYITDGFIPS